MTAEEIVAPPSWRTRARAFLRWTIFGLVVAALSQPALVLVLSTSHRRGDAPPPQRLLAQALPLGGLEQIEFATEDGIVLRGDRIGAFDRPVVVFGHGYRMRRRQGDPLAESLLARGYSVVTFDFRGSGDSDAAFTSIGAKESADVEAAFRFLTARGVDPSRTAYVGFSMGAAAGLMAADTLQGLGAVVLIAPYNRLRDTFELRTQRLGVPLSPWLTPTLRLFEWAHGVEIDAVNPIERAARIAPAPLLILGAADDWRAPPAELEKLTAAAGEATTLMVLPNGDHFDLSRFGPAIRGPIETFLEEHLPPRAE